MFLNYDLFEIVAIGFVVSGIFIYHFSTTATLNNESLVNTNSSLDSINELPSNLQYVEASVQTAANTVEPATTYVNTGMQTSPRMWLESIQNWITEILGTNPNPQATGLYVDVGVQTNGISLWGTVKQ